MNTIRIPLFGALACLCLAACPDSTTSEPAPTADVAVDVTPDALTADVTPDITADAPGPDVPSGPAMRLPGERLPQTAMCNQADATHCLLPWPSNVFTVADPTTDTGVRLKVEQETLPLDPTDGLKWADGFSRVSPIMTGFDGELDEATINLTLLVAEGDRTGEVEPTHCHYVAEDHPVDKPSACVCYPRQPLAPGTEHLAVVLDSLRYADGTAPAVDQATRVALGLVAPAGQSDVALFAYHAPARAALEAAGIDLNKVLRFWDYTTRSAENPRRDLRWMRQAALDALSADDVGIEIDSVTIPGAETSSAIVVTGRLTGIPGYAATGELPTRDVVTGDPIISQTIDAPFRAVVPKGTGDYRVVVFCHGMGGDVTDGAFDELVTSHGAMKIGIEVDGWTAADMGESLVRFFDPMNGTEITAAETIQSLAGSSAILEATRTGILSDLFAQDTIGGVPNPGAGRRPLPDRVIWAGGSLGGTMGLVFAKLEPSIVGGVLNVPGAGYTHWLPGSDLFTLVDIGLVNRYDSRFLANVVVSASQTVFDTFDGANWGDAPDENGGNYLVQISVGDPVLPNVGSNLVATSLNAVHVGVPLYSMVTLETADEAAGRSGITQFNVVGPNTSGNDIHGFTAVDRPGGHAAQDQFIKFAESLWAGTPLITAPQACLTTGPDTSCDFSTLQE